MTNYANSIDDVEVITAVSPIDQLKMLQGREVDAIIGYVNYHYLINLQMLTEIKYSFSTPELASCHIAITKDNKILTSILNKAILALPDGHMASIINKWVDKYIPKTSQKQYTDELNFSKEEKRWLQNHSKLRVASLQDFAPFSFLQNTKPSGYTVEYIKALGDKLGLELEFVTAPWRDLLKMLGMGQIDLIPYIADTKERREFVDYTDFNHITYATGFATRKNEQINSIDDLSGKTVAVADKTFLHEHLSEYHPDITLLVTKNTSMGIEAVAQDQAFAVAGNLPYLNYYIQEEWYNNLKSFSLVATDVPTKTALPMGVKKGNSLLLSIIEKAHKSDLKQVELQLKQKWLHANEITQDDYSLSDDEINFLEKHKTISFRIRTGRPPFEFIKDGKAAGIAVDYLTLIAKSIGFTPEFVIDDSPVDIAFDIVESGTGAFDTLAYLVKSEERAKRFSFGDTYLSYPMMVISHQNGPYIGSISDLSGKKVVIEKGFLTSKWVERDYPKIEIVPADSTKEALLMVNDEEFDAYIGNLGVANYMMIHKGMTNLKIVAPTEYGNVKYNFVGPKRWPELISILNKGYRSLSPTDHTLIQQKWFSVQVINTHNYALMWKVIALISFIILCILYWNYSLRNEKNNTATALSELQTAQDLLEVRNEELQYLSITDPLTSLYNRLKLDEVLIGEIERAKRYNVIFGIILIDIDHFKDINDTYGHLAGDQFLMEFSQIVKNKVRRVDIFGRWGGEEFLIICPQSDVKGLQILAENLRKTVDKHDFKAVGHRTASFGVSLFKEHSSAEELISSADSALYESKASGRNKVTLK